MGTYLHPDAPAERNEVVALYSGGVDSYCMAYLTQPDVLCNVNMGGRYGDAERARLCVPPGMADRLVKVDAPAICQYEDPVTSIVPGRNAFLALFGAQYGSTLLLASVYEEAHVGGADKDEGWAQAMHGLFDHMFQPQRWLPNGRKVRIQLPVHHLTKAQLVGRALFAGHPAELLARSTFSCYQPLEDTTVDYTGGVARRTWHECGNCGACARKWAAFAVWGVDVGFRARQPLGQYVEEARRLLRNPSDRQDMRTGQWVADQLDAWNGFVRPLSEAAEYPMWEPVHAF